MKRQLHRVPVRPPVLRRQRGTMLIIALIVLVAMTLAGIATMRSVDTAGMVAGNIGFRQATVNAADQGLQVAHDWLLTNQNTGAVDSDHHSPSNSLGYWALVGLYDPDWTDPAVWLEAALVNAGTPDAGGNVVSYRIEHMCTAPGVCASTPANLTNSSGGDKGNLDRFQRVARTHFRVTVRALGPRGSLAFVQSMMRGDQ